MNKRSSQSNAELIAGLLFVLALHGIVLYGLWSYKLIPAPDEAVTLLVNLINPPPQKKEEPPKPPPPKKKLEKVKLEKPRPIEPPKPQPVLVAKAAVVSAAEPVAPPPRVRVIEAPPAPPEPVVEAPPKPPAPVMLSSELSVSCPQRSAPDYPSMSRRLNEQGRVELRVELDEEGRVASVRVHKSSGFKRLDEAGVQAIKRWQCNAAKRNGIAARAVAMQPFDFILEGE
ncbi:MAG: energy transducer TonB [Methylophilaceae bacterium]|nr:energy transducer TonB [Methylophilaceae bacterium]